MAASPTRIPAPASPSVSTPTFVKGTGAGNLSPSSPVTVTVLNSPTSPASPASPSPRLVYSFGGGSADGHIGLRSELGGKGAGLAEMTALGLNVPPGFTLTTSVCRYYLAHSHSYPPELHDAVSRALSTLEVQTNRSFGCVDSSNPKAPLLLSVRSGAAVSMPGMMDTVLNLGLNDVSVEALAADSGDPRFAYDSYRRLVSMFGNVVLGINAEKFEHLLQALKDDYNASLDVDLPVDALKTLVVEYKQVILRETGGTPFPEHPHEQLWACIGAVFESWDTPRAVTYRKLHNLTRADVDGTAVNVQAMVFGNYQPLPNEGEGDQNTKASATGVVFSRDPATGERYLYGEYLQNAQGEDVVSGVRTPGPVSEHGRLKNMKQTSDSSADLQSMQVAMPGLYTQLEQTAQTLESHFADIQDIEFTVQRGELFILQTRSAKRAAAAAVRAAVDMAEEGLITRAQALRRVSAGAVRKLLHRQVDAGAARDATVLTTGLAASPGAGAGKVVFHPEDVLDDSETDGEGRFVLVRMDTSPDDVSGMAKAAAVLTARGGMTSHAAVVARGLGVPCVCGAGGVTILSSGNGEEEYMTVNDGRVVRRGDFVTVDGVTGNVYLGVLPTSEPSVSTTLDKLLNWADDVARVSVLANAETVRDAMQARTFGARGIGLARTEHMFFVSGRVEAMQALVLADSARQRERAVEKLMKWQVEDFLKLMGVMSGLPVTVRLIDPPLHEFLPKSTDHAALALVAMELGANGDGKRVEVEELAQRVEAMREVNPMLGLRGVRVGLVYSDVYAMQIRAMFAAAVAHAETSAEPIQLNIMVPFVADAAEIAVIKKMAEELAPKSKDGTTVTVKYTIGTMIELPRAALLAESIAGQADFFSFGTNDLTQTTFGLSRDDAGRFLDTYIQKGILKKDPFVTLDVDGVGELVKLAVERGKKGNEQLHTALCGEQGADAETVAFCHKVGMDAVSCSPFAVPVARLAAAHVALEEGC